MSKKALLALSIAVIVPFLCYYAIKWTSEENVILPRRFYVDTVITKTVNGKTTDDTVWHKTANITLINQLGDSVSLYDIRDKVIVVDFFFTRCPNICPRLTRNMARLQQSFSHYKQGRKVIDSSIVRFISFSVDPERDSVKQLKNYADRFGVDHDNWWLLTGNKKAIYDFAFNELKLGLIDGEGVDTAFIHTEKFVLIDRDKVVRGYYNGLDTTSLSRLAQDIGLLMLEKDKKKKRNLFRK
jgi:protein SCO1/2